MPRKKKDTAVPVADVPVETPIDESQLPELEFAVDTVKCGGFYEVVRVGKDTYRVNEPDPVGEYNVRSFFSSLRLREIALLNRDEIKVAVQSAPDRSKPAFIGTWKPITRYTELPEEPVEPTTQKGDDDMLRQTTGPLPKPGQRGTRKAAGTKAATKSSATKATKTATKKAGKEPALTDEKVKALIAKALKANVPNKKSALETYIRAQGHQISHARVGRLMSSKAN